MFVLSFLFLFPFVSSKHKYKNTKHVENLKCMKHYKFDESFKIIPNFFFQNCTNFITEVEFTSSLISINESAFENCQKIESVNLSQCINLKIIDQKAFFNCSSLTNIILPMNGNLEVISGAAFALTNIKEIFIPNTVKEIQTFNNSIGAFSIPSLEKITFEENSQLSSIDNFAFSTSSITSFEIPLPLTNFSPFIFANCPQLEYLSIQITDDEMKENQKKYQSFFHKNEDNDVFRFDEDEYYLFYNQNFIPDITGNINPFFGFTSLYLPFMNATCFTVHDNCLYSIDYNVLLFVPQGRSKPVLLHQKTIEITPYALMDSKISSVSFNEVIMAIGKRAFYRSDLSQVVISENCKIIAEEAFLECKQLRDVVLPMKLTKLSCGLFKDCIKLTKIDFGKKIESIGNYTFYHCKNLRSIPYCPELTQIGKYAFAFSGLNEFYISSHINKWDMFFCGTKIKELSIDENNKYFSLFSNCLYSKDLRILYFVTSGLKVLEIPQETEVFYQYCCNSSISLQSIAFSMNSSLFRIEEFCFANCFYLTSVVMPESLISIEDSAFRNCKQLKEVVLPPGLTTIQKYTFANCSSLTQIIIPVACNDIQRHSFDGCVSLQRVYIDGDPILHSSSFANCFNLQCVIWEKGNNDKLKDSGIDADLLGACKDQIEEEEYKETNRQIRLREAVVNVEKDVKYIYNFTFADSFDFLVNLSFEEGSLLKEIKSNSFIIFSELVNVDLSNCLKLKSIGNYAFAFCESLKQVILPENGVLSSIGYGCFTESSLEKIVIPDSVKEIKGSINQIGCFELCRQLENITFSFNSKLKQIEPKTFSYTKISSLVIGKSVQKIDGSAFFGCTQIKEFEISPRNVYFTIYNGSLYTKDYKELILCNRTEDDIFILTEETEKLSPASLSFTKILQVTFNNKIESIESYAFSHCYKLTQVSIPDTVIFIGSHAFEYCFNLSSFIFNSNCTTIEPFTFQYSQGLVKIQIPEAITHIYESAFANCPFLNRITGCVGLQVIEQKAFASTSIVSFWFSNTLKEVHPLAFSMCTRLKAINIDYRNRYFTCFGNCIYTYDFDRLILVLPSADGILMVKNGVGEIDDSAAENSNINELILPSSISIIGKLAFSNSSKLKNVVLPVGLKMICSYAFFNCSSLTNLNIPSTVEVIGLRTFAHCLKIFSISIPESTKIIGAEAFRYCTSLSELVVSDFVEEIGENAFYQTNLKCGVIWPLNLIENIEYAGLDKTTLTTCPDNYEEYLMH